MKKVLFLVLIFAIALLTVSTAFAAEAPCFDADGDGSPSGFEYAKNHIVPLAHDGVLGQGHKPGSHHGFSLCNPSGK